MFKKKKNYLKQIYKMNPDTKAYIIEVSLIDYNEIFNGWDPSPIKRRDLDPDLISFGRMRFRYSSGISFGTDVLPA